MQMIRDGERKEGTTESSGKLSNPGKRYFVKMEAQVVREVNAHRDKNGVTYARKAMIRCGQGMDLCGHWREEQLSYELQRSVKQYPTFFDGTHRHISSDDSERSSSTPSALSSPVRKTVEESNKISLVCRFWSLRLTDKSVRYLLAARHGIPLMHCFTFYCPVP
jgi:hypothetical protein